MARDNEPDNCQTTVEHADELRRNNDRGDGEASLESARQGDHRRGGALGAGEKPAPGLRMGMNAE